MHKIGNKNYVIHIFLWYRGQGQGQGQGQDWDQG